MRVEAPESFSVILNGPEGAYELSFEPVGDWDGVIDTEINGVSMCWNVDNIERSDSGTLLLSGITQGTEQIWGDCFWFELALGNNLVRVDYWGNQVLLRRDYPNSIN